MDREVQKEAIWKEFLENRAYWSGYKSEYLAQYTWVKLKCYYSCIIFSKPFKHAQKSTNKFHILLLRRVPWN